jgi:hypothetical protein
MPPASLLGSLNLISHGSGELCDLLLCDFIPYLLSCLPQLVKRICRPRSIRDSILEQVP